MAITGLNSKDFSMEEHGLSLSIPKRSIVGRNRFKTLKTKVIHYHV